MEKGFTRIALAEPSDIIYEGLLNSLLKHDSHLQFFRVINIEDFIELMKDVNVDVLIINPVLSANWKKTLKALRSSYPVLRIYAFLYSHFPGDYLSLFDSQISVYDSAADIVNTIINRQPTQLSDEPATSKESLSERETDVLVQLVKGLSNKEIADVLNISIHTVISHRKNITQKTGIKSQSGLTIYALMNNIVSLDSVSD